MPILCLEVMDMTTLTATNRTKFAAILRLVRADRTLRVYGRLGGFGRVLMTDAFRIALPGWTPKPPMNIHRAA